jgi:hypothetical protein
MQRLLLARHASQARAFRSFGALAATSLIVLNPNIPKPSRTVISEPARKTNVEARYL